MIEIINKKIVEECLESEEVLSFIKNAMISQTFKCIVKSVHAKLKKINMGMHWKILMLALNF